MIRKLLNIETAYAHCDIPCGIYDPYPAQIDAQTVLRMMDLINAIDANDPERKVKFSRYVATKEEHGEALKNKIRVIWGDFMKPENTDSSVTDLVWKIMKKAGSARQTSSVETAKELVELVNQFSEAFWKIKGKETKRVPSPYPTDAEMVLPA
jgi:nickel superoxide dismutase